MISGKNGEEGNETMREKVQEKNIKQKSREEKRLVFLPSLLFRDLLGI